MRLIDADKLYPDTLIANKGVAISQSQLAKAPTIQAIPIEVLDKIKEEIWVSRNTTYDKAEIVNLIDKYIKNDD